MRVAAILGLPSPFRLVDRPYQTLILTFASERRCSYSGTTGVTVSFNGSGSTNLGYLRKSDHTYAGIGTYRRVNLQQTLMCSGSRLESSDGPVQWLSARNFAYLRLFN
jgi:hypothetical protein